MIRLIPTIALLLVSACFPGGSIGNFANRERIIEAADSCGVADFEPTKAGGMGGIRAAKQA
jgi:hypothetical protein